MNNHILYRAFAVVLIISALAGCASMDRTVAMTQQTVTPMASGEATNVPAEALARAMLQAGFTRDDVLEHGPMLRNALATAGSAQMRNGGEVSALFAVYADQLYVTSRMRGTFMQPLSLGL